MSKPLICSSYFYSKRMRHGPLYCPEDLSDPWRRCAWTMTSVTAFISASSPVSGAQCPHRVPWSSSLWGFVSGAAWTLMGDFFRGARFDTVYFKTGNIIKKKNLKLINATKADFQNLIFHTKWTQFWITHLLPFTSYVTWSVAFLRVALLRN